MESRVSVAVIAAVCGLAAPALAQDSTSSVPAAGDAVGAYDAAEQRNRYVVDLTPFATSWGTQLGIAPLMKSSKVSAGFYNNLTSAQAISSDLLGNVCLPFETYQYWNAPGFGIEGSRNLAPNTVTGPSRGVQFAATVSEFGTADAGGSYNGVISGRVAYDPRMPGRLYVERVLAASNGATGSENRSQFGIGSIDATGNVHFRGDGNGGTGPNTLVGNNLFRVDTAERTTGVLNVVDNAGFSDAGLLGAGADSAWALQNHAEVHNPPNIVAESVAGRPIIFGTNFLTQHVYEGSFGTVTATGAHLCGSPDQRGTAAFSSRTTALGGIGMGGVLAKGPSGTTDSFSVWGVGANGAPTGNCRLLTLPAAPADPCYNFTFGSGSGNEFHLYHGATAFRGGNSPVAIGRDQAGRTLVAGPVRDNLFGGSSAPINAIAVARFTGTAGAVEWTVAAWNNFPNGKPILNGPGGAAVGQLVELNQVTGGTPIGPSMSAPAIDSVGNIYFVSAVEHFSGPSGQAGDPENDFDTALIRAVYNPAQFCYDLELVVSNGDVFVGQNSTVPYAITFLNLAGNTSIDPAGFWSENVSQSTAHGVPGANLQPADPRTLGGVVLNSRITYDTNGDGDFDTALEESYRAMLYIGSVAPGPFCPPDMNNDGGLSVADFTAFRSTYLAGNSAADFNCDGALSVADFTAFRAAYLGGCQ